MTASSGGQPSSFRAVPLMLPVPLLFGQFIFLTKPNVVIVRLPGGSHSCSDGVPVPSLPSSTPNATGKPPSKVESWIQPEPFGGVTWTK